MRLSLLPLSIYIYLISFSSEKDVQGYSHHTQGEIPLNFEFYIPIWGSTLPLVIRGNRPKPLFIGEDGKYLTWEMFVTVGIKEGRLPSQRICRSKLLYCCCAATAAGRCGIQDSLIKTLRHWKSSACTRYIRAAPETLCEVQYLRS